MFSINERQGGGSAVIEGLGGEGASQVHFFIAVIAYRSAYTRSLGRNYVYIIDRRNLTLPHRARATADRRNNPALEFRIARRSSRYFPG